jgi:hypothetical protein
MSKCDVCGDFLDADSYVIQVTERAGFSSSNFKSYDCCMRCGSVVANGIESRKRRYNR